MPVDFGLLQSAQAPHSGGVVGTPINPNQGFENTMGVLSQLRQQQDSAAQRQAQNLQMQQTQQQMAHENQLFPGQMAQQQAQLGATQAQTAASQAATQGTLLSNKIGQLNLTDAQKEATYKQNDHNAYVNTLQKTNDPNAALTAYIASTATHNPEASMKLQTTWQDTQDKIRNGNTAQLADNAAILNGIQQEKDPVAAFNRPIIQKELKKNDPNIPVINNEQDLHDYSLVTMGSALPYKDQAKVNYTLLQDKAKINSQATADITKNQIQDAQTKASGAQEIEATANTYGRLLDQADQEGIKLGPGQNASAAIKKLAVGVGLTPEQVSTLGTNELLSAASSKMLTGTMSQLKTMPRNPLVVKAFEDALPNPNMTREAQRQLLQNVQYGAKLPQAYRDFLMEYKDANGGSTTGADVQWKAFQGADPQLQSTGKLDPGYLSPENYKPFLDKSYVPPKPQQSQTSGQGQSAASPGQAQQNNAVQQPITKQIGGATYIQHDGKWYTQ